MTRKIIAGKAHIFLEGGRWCTVWAPHITPFKVWKAAANYADDRNMKAGRDTAACCRVEEDTLQG